VGVDVDVVNEPAPTQPPAAIENKGEVASPAGPPAQAGEHFDIDADAATDDERNRRPRYPRFGGEPEPPIEPGTWDPWAHPVRDRFSHDGFFLRLNLGPAFATVWRPDYQWNGLGLGLNISVGGSVIQNLAIHADFRGTLIGNPTQRSRGRKTDFDADIVFESMGVGATYYLMPANVYASLGAGVGVLAFEDDSGASKDTSAGLTVSGTIGKEWWVGSDWGLGIAGQLLYIRVRDYVDEERMHGLSFSLLFSATYN
jgi:hypothetical protein